MTFFPDKTKRILIVEDSESVIALLRPILESATDLPVDSALSLAECNSLLDKYPKQYQIAIVDLGLPDAPDGQAVDRILSFGIATIVLTGSLNSSVHARISAKPIVDYVTKQTPGAMAIVQQSVQRTLRNMACKVLVADSDPANRAYIKSILSTQCLQVMEVDTVSAALQAVEKYRDIAAVITTYNLSSMGGIDLCMKLRANFPGTKLAIMGITGEGNDFDGVRFFKSGADDIIRKPFLVEEFVSRLNTRLDYLDSLRTIQDQANRDYLTKLYNRRYFMEAGNILFGNAKRGHVELMVAMVDIDLFKQVNDKYGHDIGDQTIVAVARTIAGEFRSSDIIARVGGEEFCIIAVNNKATTEKMERLRKQIVSLAIPINNQEPLHVSVSIGVTSTLGESLEEMVRLADKALYKAKQSGRNQVVLS